MLKEGSAVIGRRAGGTLPKGMQHGSTVNKEIKHATAVGLELEINYAMATVVESMEGSMPTYGEGKKTTRLA